jgi:hypothetical protein
MLMRTSYTTARKSARVTRKLCSRVGDESHPRTAEHEEASPARRPFLGSTYDATTGSRITRKNNASTEWMQMPIQALRYLRVG